MENGTNNCDAEQTLEVEDIKKDAKEPKMLFGLVSLPQTEEDGMDLAIKIDQVCRLAIPGLFILLNAIYWGVYGNFV